MVLIELNQKDENKRLKLFALLESYRVILEEGFDKGLVWDLCYERESGEQVSRIYVENQDYDYHRQQHWGEIFDFFINNMLKLEFNFLEIQDILKENLKEGF